MSPDELPERDCLTFKYGDQEYTTVLTGQLASHPQIKHAVMAHVLHALREYHGSQGECDEMMEELFELVHLLCSRYENVRMDPEVLNFLYKGEFYGS